jgi:dihydroxyacetone kinase-like protein
LNSFWSIDFIVSHGSGFTPHNRLNTMSLVSCTSFPCSILLEEKLEVIDTAGLAAMIDAGLKGLQEVVPGEVEDKTLVDTLVPANNAIQQAAKAGKPLREALQDMKVAAAAGRDSTKELVAKFGRSSRLGERSRGVLDAGAVSCCIILTAIADGILEQLNQGA